MIESTRHQTLMWVALVAAAWPWAATAHPGVHGRIEAVTRRIAAKPTDAALYLERGELCREHADFDSALADFERTSWLDPDNDELLYARGQLYLDAGWPHTALLMLTEYVARCPNNGRAIAARARALSQLSRHYEAAEQYTQALQHLKRPEPEHYIARAHCLAAAGESHLAEAIQGLDEAIAELGPVITLQLCAIELELSRNAYDLALRRVDQIARAAHRQEKWLVKRGQLLEQAQRRVQAIAAYRDAMDAIKALPPRHRNTPAARELEHTVREAIDRLTTTPLERSQPAALELNL